MSGTVEVRIEIDGSFRRHLLEERVGVVPRPQIRDRAPEPRRQALVERALPAREGPGGHAVRLGERLREPLLVQLVSRQRQREPVAMAESARSLVPQARELAHVVRDDGADGLRRLPGLAPLAQDRRSGGGSA